MGLQACVPECFETGTLYRFASGSWRTDRLGRTWGVFVCLFVLQVKWCCPWRLAGKRLCAAHPSLLPKLAILAAGWMGACPLQHQYQLQHIWWLQLRSFCRYRC